MLGGLRKIGPMIGLTRHPKGSFLISKLWKESGRSKSIEQSSTYVPSAEFPSRLKLRLCVSECQAAATHLHINRLMAKAVEEKKMQKEREFTVFRAAAVSRAECLNLRMVFDQPPPQTAKEKREEEEENRKEDKEEKKEESAEHTQQTVDPNQSVEQNPNREIIATEKPTSSAGQDVSPTLAIDPLNSNSFQKDLQAMVSAAVGAELKKEV